MYHHGKVILFLTQALQFVLLMVILPVAFLSPAGGMSYFIPCLAFFFISVMLVEYFMPECLAVTEADEQLQREIELVQEVQDPKDYVTITISITGNCVRHRGNERGSMDQKLIGDLVMLMDVEMNTMEMTESKVIENGIELTLRVRYDDKVNANMNFENLLRESKQSGLLSQIVKEAWILDDNPAISIDSFDSRQTHPDRQEMPNVSVLSVPAEEVQLLSEVEM